MVRRIGSTENKEGRATFAKRVAVIFETQIKRGKRPSDKDVGALADQLWPLLTKKTAPPLLSRNLRSALGVVLVEAPQAIERLKQRPGKIEQGIAKHLVSMAEVVHGLTTLLPGLADLTNARRSNADHFVWRIVFRLVNETLRGAGRRGSKSGEKTVAVKITVKILSESNINIEPQALSQMLRRHVKPNRITYALDDPEHGIKA